MRTHGEKEMLSAEDLTRIHTHVHMLTHTQTTYDIPDTVISKTFKNLKRLK